MSALAKVFTYTAGKVHWAVPRREDLLAVCTPDEATVEAWWYWKSLCGREIIGRSTTSSPVMADYEINCRSCEKVMEHSREVYEQLAERFGLRP